MQGTSPGLCDPNSLILRIWSSGPKVQELQRYLTQFGYGYLLEQDGIDGKSGPATQNAVKTFLQENGLDLVDGIVGPRTWDVLCNYINSAAATTTNSATTTRPRIIDKTYTFRADNKNGALLGYAGYGGGSSENALLQLRANGKFGITNQQIAVLKGVASVEQEVKYSQLTPGTAQL